MIKLYNTQRAPSARRARILLAEKSASYENIQVDLRQKENMGEVYLQINPRGTVPTLVTEEGDIFCENVSIASYIEERFPEPPLLGTTPAERANILEWNTRAETDGFTSVAEIFRNSHEAFIDRALTGVTDHAQIPALVERGRRRTAAFFEALNTSLEGREFVASDGFSFADITCAIVVDFAGWEPIAAAPEQSLKALHDWHKRVSERNSYSS